MASTCARASAIAACTCCLDSSVVISRHGDWRGRRDLHARALGSSPSFQLAISACPFGRARRMRALKQSCVKPLNPFPASRSGSGKAAMRSARKAAILSRLIVRKNSRKPVASCDEFFPGRPPLLWPTAFSARPNFQLANMLEEAVDLKIAEQRKLVAWWEGNVTGQGGRPAKKPCRVQAQFSYRDAERETRMAHQRISDQIPRTRDLKCLMLEAEGGNRPGSRPVFAWRRTDNRKPIIRVPGQWSASIPSPSRVWDGERCRRREQQTCRLVEGGGKRKGQPRKELAQNAANTLTMPEAEANENPAAARLALTQSPKKRNGLKARSPRPDRLGSRFGMHRSEILTYHGTLPLAARRLARPQ